MSVPERNPQEDAVFVGYDSVPNEAGWRIVFSSKGEKLVEISSAKALVIKQRRSGVGLTISTGVSFQWAGSHGGHLICLPMEDGEHSASSTSGKLDNSDAAPFR